MPCCCGGRCGDCYPDTIFAQISNINFVWALANAEPTSMWGLSVAGALVYGNTGGGAFHYIDFRVGSGVTRALTRSSCTLTWQGSIPTMSYLFSYNGLTQRNEYTTQAGSTVLSMTITPGTSNFRLSAAAHLAPGGAMLNTDTSTPYLVATATPLCVTPELFSDHQIYWRIGSTQSYSGLSSVVLGRGFEPNTGAGLMKLTLFP